MTIINIIVACDNNKGIGKNNNIPWYNKDDMKLFYKLTKGNKKNAIVMGRFTWDSLPKKPLPERDNLIISKTLTTKDNYNVFNCYDELFKFIKNKKYEEIWIIGGSQIYNYFINTNLIDYIYLTKQNGSYDCDTFFIFDENKYKKIKEEHINDESKLEIYYLK